MPDLYQVTAKRGLRLRGAPINGPVITSMSYGDIVERIGTSPHTDWWQIRTTAGRNVESGFAHKDYLYAFDPKPKTNPFSFSNLEASFDRVKNFVGDFAESQSADILPILNDILTDYEINKSPKRFCHFMAQIAHESAHFTAMEENLRYSARGLWRVFPKYFDSFEHAKDFQGQAERIANRVYANRMGNGSEESGDGWRYRGRGFIQLTGRDNYKRIGDRIKLPLETDPDLITRDLAVAVRVAADYWDSRNLNKAADLDDLLAVTRGVNGGYNGLSDRKTLLKRARAIWG